MATMSKHGRGNHLHGHRAGPDILSGGLQTTVSTLWMEKLETVSQAHIAQTTI